MNARPENQLNVVENRNDFDEIFKRKVKEMNDINASWSRIKPNGSLTLTENAKWKANVTVTIRSNFLYIFIDMKESHVRNPIIFKKIYCIFLSIEEIKSDQIVTVIILTYLFIFTAIIERLIEKKILESEQKQ